jgi:hypothetical protein
MLFYTTYVNVHSYWVLLQKLREIKQFHSLNKQKFPSQITVDIFKITIASFCFCFFQRSISKPFSHKLKNILSLFTEVVLIIKTNECQS